MKYSQYNQDHINVARDGNVIYIYSMNHPRVVTQFISCLKDGIRMKYEKFKIVFSVKDQVFPCAAVPIAGLLELEREHNIEFEFQGLKSVSNFQIVNPSKYGDQKCNVLNKVWKFESSSDVCFLVDRIIDSLGKEDKYYKGQLDTIEWSLNEVMDNVLQHSNVNMGYVMTQIHKSTKVIAITVFDCGQGIYKSLKDTKHCPHNASDAITLAIQEGVTRDNSIGQGNGLFGLYSVVNKGKGTLYITSGDGAYMLDERRNRTYINIPFLSYRNPCTTIDFRLNYSLDLSIDKAIVIKGKEHVLQSIRTESFENLEGTYYTYKIKERAEGTGTRESAIRVKNDISNILIADPKPMLIDFSEIEVISSSFADELIAKLLMEYGLFQFNVMFKLKGLDEGQQRILQKSVLQRIYEMMNEE